MNTALVAVGIALLLAIAALAFRRLFNMRPAEGMTEAAYRKEVRRLYPNEFAFHHAAIFAIEPAIARPRKLDSVVRFALDMLLTQAYKSHYAVSLLAERGQVEDAATMTRRLLELGVQALYISDDDDVTREQRAGAYLAHLWRSSPDKLRSVLPPEARQHWEEIFLKYQSALPKTPSRWGPKWFEMFALVGRADTYAEDYSLLSSIAHGSTVEGLLHYSLDQVPLRTHRHAPTLLVYSTKYYIGTAGLWNNQFDLLAEENLTVLLEHAKRFDK